MNWQELRTLPCKKCDQLSWSIVGETNNGGHQIHRVVCSACGYRTPVLVQKKLMEKYASHIGRSVEYLPPKEFAPDCEVCGTKGAEEHHWAPRSIFGEDADKWPKSHLCPPCHALWHSKVTAP